MPRPLALPPPLDIPSISKAISCPPPAEQAAMWTLKSKVMSESPRHAILLDHRRGRALHAPRGARPTL